MLILAHAHRFTTKHIGDNPLEGNYWSVKSHGSVHVEFTYGEEWERLEEIVDMTED